MQDGAGALRHQPRTSFSSKMNHRAVCSVHRILAQSHRVAYCKHVAAGCWLEHAVVAHRSDPAARPQRSLETVPAHLKKYQLTHPESLACGFAMPLILTCCLSSRCVSCFVAIVCTSRPTSRANSKTARCSKVCTSDMRTINDSG